MVNEDKIMDTYIVHIYRFQKDNPRGLVGIVESVEAKKREKSAFTNFDELWEILNCSTDPDLSDRSGRKTTKAE